MFRSADTHDSRVVTLSTAVAALALLAATGTAALAQPPQDTAPVLQITAPIVDIHTGSSTLDGAVAIEDRDRDGTAVRLDSSVLFGNDSARLRPSARTTISTLARQLRRTGPGAITVTGYTDDLGPAKHGLQLSKRRAAAVAHELGRHLGSDWPKITTVGKGEADPAVPNTSEANRKLNRRVVVTVQR